MNIDDGDGSKLSHRLQDGNRKVKNAEGRSLFQENELKTNGIAQDLNDGHGGAIQGPPLLQMPQQQSQGAIVCWERFLNLRSLKVLLVENDDSTRHVVTALLRNCSYEVIEAANGLQAWKMLEDLTNHIDLVLTEVVMPCLSGISLLCKIMSHKTHKNVPVIMMSSHDSMGLVLKCLSKGAVDFLVKPIRKNELKNLWQHVWRRCHSSSGSGSESGAQTQKSVKSKIVEKSDNNTGRNDEDDIGSSGLNMGDGSDHGSGTQSSCTKQPLEVESRQPVSPWDQVAECPDSTCAQVIHSNAETSGNKLDLVAAGREWKDEEEQLDIDAMAKDLEMGVPRNLNLQLQHPVEVPIKLAGTKQNDLLEMGSGKFHEQIDRGQLDLNIGNQSSKLKYEAVVLSGVTTDPHMDQREVEAPKRLSKVSDINTKAINETKEMPSLKLSLKRLGVKDIVTTIHDDRNVLRCSNSSAFSRYNTASNAIKAPDGNPRSNSPDDNSLEVMKKGSAHDIQSLSNGNPPNQSSNGGSNNIDMCPTTDNASNKPVVLKIKSAATSTVKCLQTTSAFQPMKNDILCAPQQAVSEKADDVAAIPMLVQPRAVHEESQMEHLHHFDPHHHNVHNMQQQHLPPDSDTLSLKKMAAIAPHGGSSNVLGGPVDANAGNYSINGSASGRNHGSSTAGNAGGTNLENDNGIGDKSGSGDAGGSGIGNTMDLNKFAQREAALIKFCQKRKERCFHKKVRYQSKKKLAEQRPVSGDSLYG